MTMKMMKKTSKYIDQMCVEWLQRKIDGQTLETNIVILERNLFGEEEPWLVFGERPEKELYFFTPVTPKYSGKSVNRTAGGGAWKGDTTGVKIKNGETLGERKTFTFAWKGSEYKDGERWTMHEYRLIDLRDKRSEIALCKVKRCHERDCSRKKRRRLGKENEDHGEENGLELLISKVEQEVNTSKEHSINEQQTTLDSEKDLLDDSGIKEFAGELLKGIELYREEEEMLIPNTFFTDSWVTGCELMIPRTNNT